MIAITGIILIGSSTGLFTWYVLGCRRRKEEPGSKPLSIKPFKNHSIIYSITGFILGWLVMRSILAGAVCALVSYFVPGMITRWDGKRRTEKLNNQLVDAIGIINSSLRAGFSLLQGISAAAKRLPEPISGELNTVVRENQLGVSLEESLLELGRRVNSDDFDLVITATLVSYETGGNITEVYDNIASTIRGRNMMQLRLKTITSQGRLQGIVVGLLPVILLVILSRIAPDMIEPLFHTFAGIMMLVGAFVLELLGMFFIKRITTIDM